MIEAKFILSKEKLLEQVKILEDIGFKISYSYKTNREVGNVLQEISEVDFSIHAKEEVNLIEDKNKIWFFMQAESKNELIELIKKGIKNFVVDNKIDLEELLEIIKEIGVKINLSLRMKFQEHRIGTGKYFVYGMNSSFVNEIIEREDKNHYLERIGIHIHRKSQNTSEWEIVSELEDSIKKENLQRIDFVNLGGGLPTEYKSYNSKINNYIFDKLKCAKVFLDKYGVEAYIEPGRFLAAPCIKLETEIIQLYDNKIILNTTIYNCALDTILTGTKMLVEEELGDEDEGEDYLIKGNSPTRDDIFRYKVKLKNPQVGDKIVFLNAGAYNYSTDFFGYKKLRTEILEKF